MAKAVAINRSKKHEALVQNFAGENAVIFDESGKKLFITIREFLTFAALLGFKNRVKIPIDRTFGTEDIQGTTYEDTEALEFIWLIAIVDTGGVDILKDGNEKECANIFEEYANAGLQLISDYLEESPTDSNFQTLVNKVSNIVIKN